MEVLNTGPETSPTRLLLAHGAGAPMTSPFLEDMARLLAEQGLAVSRFEFSYMAERRQGGKKRPPPRADALKDEFAAAIAEVAAHLKDGQNLIIGGKSMGGRVASLVADQEFSAGRIAGLVCLGYPFHLPKKPESLRTEHLRKLVCPALIVQGERDPFGNRAEVNRLQLSPAIQISWIPDGDHDFVPRVRSGTTAAENLKTAADQIVRFTEALQSLSG